MPGAPYHADAFPLPGRCFRLVAHYGEPAEPLPGAGDLAGLVAGPNSRRYRSEADEGHRSLLPRRAAGVRLLVCRHSPA